MRPTVGLAERGRRSDALKLLIVFFKKQLSHTVPLSLYFLVAIIATYPLILRATDHVFGTGTPMLNIWAMAWVNHQLPLDPWHLFDGNVFYPYSRTLAFSEHLFVPALMA